MYKTDKRIVMTLDAGGTNLVFSAIKGGEEIISPITLATIPDDLDECLKNISIGFNKVKKLLDQDPVAISFAFPGPADYKSGIIGDLLNLPCFKGGIALGPFLENEFKIPVFINNDANLFTYGEALMGLLPYINSNLIKVGSKRQYKNLIGITLGTGFGGGIVINNSILNGDNDYASSFWRLPNKEYKEYIVEESVSIRAVKRIYEKLSGDTRDLTPKEIFEIAESTNDKNSEYAIKSFEKLGEMAGDAIALAITLIDGIIVVGGGLCGAAKFILPSIIKELKRDLNTNDNNIIGRLSQDIYNIEDEKQWQEFINENNKKVNIPTTNITVDYNCDKKVAIALSKLGTNKAISLGAYAYAINNLS